MANTYDWNIAHLEVAKTQGDLSDVVVRVHYRFTGASDQLKEDGTPYTATAYGAVALENADPDDFTDFESVTHDAVIAWTLAALNTTEQELKNKIDERIALDIDPPVIVKFPSAW